MTVRVDAPDGSRWLIRRTVVRGRDGHGHDRVVDALRRGEDRDVAAGAEATALTSTGTA